MRNVRAYPARHAASAQMVLDILRACPVGHELQLPEARQRGLRHYAALDRVFHIWTGRQRWNIGELRVRKLQHTKERMRLATQTELSKHAHSPLHRQVAALQPKHACDQVLASSRFDLFLLAANAQS
jgi:hypothetical protein